MPRTNFRSPYPRRLHIKFYFDRASGFWKDVWNCLRRMDGRRRTMSILWAHLHVWAFGSGELIIPSIYLCLFLRSLYGFAFWLLQFLFIAFLLLLLMRNQYLKPLYDPFSFSFNHHCSQRISVLIFICYYCSWCCAVWRPQKVSPYTIHSAGYIFHLVLWDQ